MQKKIKIFSVNGLFSTVGWLLILFIGLGCSTQNDYKIFRMAYAMAPGGTSHMGAVHFKELVEENSKGKIKVKLYPNGVLGNESGLVESLRLNGIDMVIAGPSIIGNYAPEFGLIEAPFLFRDFDHLDKVLYGEIGEEMEQAVSKNQGLHFIDFFHRGPRYLTTTQRKIRNPKDLEGLKLRVPALPVYIRSWSIFGANPTPLDYSDMFIGLKQGVVEGQENPLEVIYTSHLYEVQDYIMETKHLLSFYVLVVGDPFFSRFDEMEQKILLGACKEAATFHNLKVQEYEEYYREKLMEKGVEFVKVDQEAFIHLAKTKLPIQFKEVWEPGIFSRIINTK
ncbi:MAG: TRAP transporter substrate-binding protein [Cyclobacteriaceae bacterium]